MRVRNPSPGAGTVSHAAPIEARANWRGLARQNGPGFRGGARSAAAKLGWIVVAGSLVLEHRRKAWVHSLAGMNDDVPRLGVTHLCGVGRSTQRDQKTQGQNRTHRVCSNRPTP